MRLKQQLLLLFILLLVPLFSMAAMHSDPDNSSVIDSIKLNRYTPNHVLLTDSLVNYGKIFLNTPYHYGSPGISSFDCSGFTSHVYRNFGYSLDHSSADQAKQFDSIDRSQLKAGDLVFFSGSRRSKKVGHVGIVTVAKENGEFDFIHAAVHSGVTISNSTEEYYTKRFVKASRVIGSNQMLAISKFITKRESPSIDTLKYSRVSIPAKTIKKVIPAEYHRVKSGETLSSISKKYGITIPELKRINSIKGSKLSLRQSLKVKDEVTVKIDQVQPSVNALAKNESNAKTEKSQTISTHKVISGETLFSIAKTNMITVDELKKLNNISNGKIHPGQELKLTNESEIKNQNIVVVDNKGKKQDIQSENKEIKIIYKIKKGENLGSIAKDNHTTIDELKRINNLTDSKIHQGQNLLLVQDKNSINQNINIEKKDNNKTVELEKRIEKQDVKLENNEKIVSHRIKKGESLISIAKENNTTVDELKKINNLTETKIKIGQEIKIHQSIDKSSSNSLVIEKELKNIEHKVKSGDTYYSIARMYGCTIDELKDWNRKSGSKIKVGDKIRINQKANKKDLSLVE